MKNFFKVKKLALIIMLGNSWSCASAMLSVTVRKTETSNLNEKLFENVVRDIKNEKPQNRVNQGSNFEFVLAYADFDNIKTPLIIKALVVEKYGSKNQILRLYTLNKESFDHLKRPATHWLYSNLENQEIEMLNSLLNVKFFIASQTHPDYLFDYKNSPFFVEITHNFQEQINCIASLLNKDRVNSEHKEKIDTF